MSATSNGGERKRGRPTTAEREERRDQILDAAVALFRTRGYGHVTLEEIASSARVTKRTVYSYFGDKADVFSAVVERFREQALGAFASTGESLVETCTQIVYVLHADDAVGMHRLMVGESLRFPELATRFYESGPRGYVDLLAIRLAGDMPSERAQLLAEALFGLLLGESHRRRLLGLSKAPTEAEAREHALVALDLLGLLAA